MFGSVFINKPNLKFEKNTKTGKYTTHIATCDCGDQILIVPDLRAMNRALRRHVKEKECSEQFLTEEILRTLSKEL